MSKTATKTAAKVASTARKGNLTIDVGEKIDEAVDALAEKKAGERSHGLSGVGGRFGGGYLGRFGGGWRPGGYTGFGMGAYELVKGGSAKPGQVLLGLVLSAPTKVLVQNVILQKALGVNPMLASGGTAALGVIAHLGLRSSASLGLAGGLLANFLGDVAEWVAGKAGLLAATAPTTTPGSTGSSLPGVNPGQQPQQQLGPNALRALEALRAKIVPGVR